MRIKVYFLSSIHRNLFSDIYEKTKDNSIFQLFPYVSSDYSEEDAIKEIKDTSIKIAVDSVKKIITTSVDKSKLDNLFNKNLEETKKELKKISS